MSKHVPRLKLLVGSWHLLKQIMNFGNPTAGGFTTMAEALWAVACLNDRLPQGYVLSVSGHCWHEIQVPGGTPKVGYSAQWNNPRAIDLDQWIEGAVAGHYAPPGRIIPPGFGLPGSDDGMFIHPDPARRQLAHDMLVYCFEQSERVISEVCGEGQVIFWTGPDGIRWKRLTEGRDVRLAHHLNPELEEWGLIVNGVGNAAKAAREAGYTETRLLIEGKPAGDPCYLCAFTDTALEVAGVKAINQVAGFNVAEWQGEFCHSRGSGQTFTDALRQVIEAGVWGGRMHLNSGGLGQTKFSDLLAAPAGTRASDFPQYVDNDFLPGEGVEEWVEDQRNTIALGAAWSAETGQTLEIEFDARFCRHLDTIGALERSTLWTIDTFEKAVAQLE